MIPRTSRELRNVVQTDSILNRTTPVGDVASLECGIEAFRNFSAVQSGSDARFVSFSDMALNKRPGKMPGPLS